MRRAAIAVGLVAVGTTACNLPGSYYVADVRRTESGALVQRKCEFGRGGACHEEEIEAAPPVPASPEELSAAAAEVKRAEKAIPPRPAPTEQDVVQALASPGVRTLLSQCRTAYAPNVTTIRFAITVRPSGKLVIALHDATNPFADCATHALQSADLHPFDGGPVTFEQQLDL